MSLTSPSPISLRYWDMLKSLTSVVNKEVAEEPELTEEERKHELLSLAGCWADDPEDAARMEAAIKDGRKNEFMREINLDD